MAQVSHKSHMDLKKPLLQDIGFVMDSLEEINHLNDFIHNIQKEWATMVAKLQKERMTALAALSRSKIMLAKMQVFIAKNQLKNDHVGQKEKSQGSTSDQNFLQHAPYRRNSTTFSSSRSSIDSSSCGSTSCHTSFSQGSPITSKVDQSKDSSISSRSSISSSGNETSSPTSHSPVLVACQTAASQAISPTFTTNSNRSLSESIIAEFNKPYRKSHTMVSSTVSTSSSGSSTPKRGLSPVKEIPQKRSRNIKIKPVPNMAEYKKAYSQDSLSYKTHVLYAPNGTNMRPSLHPQDPRANSKLTLDAREKQTQTPISLAIPPMMQNNNNSIPKQVVPGKQAKINTPKQAPNTSITETQTHLSISSISPVNSKNRCVATSTPVKHAEERHVSQPTLKLYEIQYKSVSSTPKPKNQGFEVEKKAIQKPLLTKIESQQFHVPTGHNIEQGHDISVYTPQKWFENKHICVPTPPMYERSVTFGRNHSLNRDPRINRISPIPRKKVTFYHST